MSASGETAPFRLVPLGLRARRKRWGAGCDEPDAQLLWPGVRAFLSQWLAGDQTIVVAALADDGRVAARALFSRSVVRPDLWFYGNLVTHPEFRRRGLGLAVTRLGLETVRARGARCSACYIAEDNLASQALNEQVGCRALSYVRLRLCARDGGPPAGTILLSAPETDVRDLPGSGPLLEALGPAEGREVVLEEMVVRRPLLPWKSPGSALARVERDGDLLALVRCGRQVANVIASPGLAGRDLARAFAAVGTLLRSRFGVGQLFAFAPRAAIVGLDEPFDRIYWNPDVRSGAPASPPGPSGPAAALPERRGS